MGLGFGAHSWQYPCLYQQPDRTDEQQAAFQRGLKMMAGAYASPRTLVLQHKDLPITFDLKSGAPTYEWSGWCTM
jgi:hypothetical protein